MYISGFSNHHLCQLNWSTLKALESRDSCALVAKQLLHGDPMLRHIHIQINHVVNAKSTFTLNKQHPSKYRYNNPTAGSPRNS